jgi:hypothetical protein
MLQPLLDGNLLLKILCNLLKARLTGEKNEKKQVYYRPVGKAVEKCLSGFA